MEASKTAPIASLRGLALFLALTLIPACSSAPPRPGDPPSIGLVLSRLNAQWSYETLERERIRAGVPQQTPVRCFTNAWGVAQCR